MSIYQTDFIRKIKILINKFRARNDVSYNKDHGILPMIVIYPKYGVINAQIVIKKLSYYFWKQVTIGWKCSQPTYFIQINNLLYYTNGAINIKMYYRKVLEKSKKFR